MRRALRWQLGRSWGTLFVAGLLVASAGRATAAIVTTDLPDYAPGETVTVTGSGWQPGETVGLNFDDGLESITFNTVADADGNISDTDFVADADDVDQTFALTATGISSGETAQTTFTDANPCLGQPDGTNCGNGSNDCQKKCVSQSCDAGNASSGSACGSGPTQCSNQDTCNGSGVCLPNDLPAGTLCGSGPTDCSNQDTCDGSGTCLANDLPTGTACSSDGNDCTDDKCNGGGSCIHPASAAGTPCGPASTACSNQDTCDGNKHCTDNGFKPSSTVCRASAGQCDVAEHCTGTSGLCPTDQFASASTSCTGSSQGGACDNDAADHCAGTSNTCVDAFKSAATVCRPSAGQCDVAETCTGASGVCPADAFASSSTSCTGSSQGGACDNDAQDHCTGTNATTCVDVFEPSATVCRPSAGQCDVAETCTGVSGLCPVDTFASSTTSCTGSSQGGVCDNDAQDHCTGTDATTCVDVFKSVATVCRPSAGQCDVAETCTGASGTCPADAFAAATTSCAGNSQGGACDNDAADHCAGTSNTCVDAFQSVATVCRESAGQCDVAENCTGDSGACPSDVFASSSTLCTGSSQGGACDDDAADHCTGTDATTCVDVFKSSATVCRPSAGQCDVADFCTGASGACPADTFASSSTSCTGSSEGGACDDDAADHCTGTSNTCVDAFKSSATVCRPAHDTCDVAETCTGNSGACPTDQFASSSTSCTGSSQGGACDNDAADHCAGTSDTCVDVFKSSATVCRLSAGQCDVAESCTGTSGLCPTDQFASASTSCTGSSQGGACDDDATDHCTGTDATTCLDVFKSSATVCRPAVDVCDVAETCTGDSGACPTDQFASSSTFCTGSSQGGACDDDTADHCAGTSDTCVDVFESSATVCRPAFDVCDVAETCTGTAGACPTDQFASSTTSCTGSSQGGACDNDAADHCAGTSDTCVDVFKSSATVCRPAVDVCDVAESCTGVSGLCPADQFASSTTSCTGSSQGGACDNDTADHCAGTSDTCVDVFKSSATVCRAAHDGCDVAETCTGTAGTCPIDVFASSSTSCIGSSQGGACDNDAADHCAGTSDSCVDVFKSSTIVCRAAHDTCDVAESCTGTSGACPTDQFASSSTHCTGSSQGGSCDNDAADHCAGTSDGCVDAFKASTVTCRAAAGLCDVAESCTGSSGACPADAKTPAGTSCENNDMIVCTADVCDGKGNCISTPVDARCDDGNDCSVDTCNPPMAPDATGCVHVVRTSVSTGCTPSDPSHPNSCGCNDHNPCTKFDRCQYDGTGTGNIVCAGDNVADNTKCSFNTTCASSAICLSGVCTPQGYAPFGTPCDDGNVCTGTTSVPDACDGSGHCVAGPLNDVACDDGNDCTTDDHCGMVAISGTQFAPGCLGVPMVGTCDDGDACTGDTLFGTTPDTCQSGTCTSGSSETAFCKALGRQYFNTSSGHCRSTDGACCTNCSTKQGNTTCNCCLPKGRNCIGGGTPCCSGTVGNVTMVGQCVDQTGHAVTAGVMGVCR